MPDAPENEPSDLVLDPETLSKLDRLYYLLTLTTWQFWQIIQGAHDEAPVPYSPDALRPGVEAVVRSLTQWLEDN